jgi:small subunit ribosomal protein S4
MLSEAKRAKARRGGRPRRPTDYGLQLLEKQKVRFMYGVQEKQFRNYIAKASKAKDVTPATRLFQLLEARLDNAVYRLGLAPTRGASRQMASHGHLTVNGKRTTVPSQHLKEGDVIAVREGSKDSALFQDLDKKMKNAQLPAWLNWDAKKMEGQVKGVALEPDAFLDFQSVIEFYSR